MSRPPADDSGSSSPPPKGNPSGDDWVAVAIFQRPHGLRGTTRVRPLTRSLADFLDMPNRTFAVRRLGRVNEAEQLTIDWMEPDAEDTVRVKFKEIGDRTEAEHYTNAELLIRESERWEIDEGQYWLDDLAGLEIRDAETDARLGVVSHATDGIAHDYLVLKLDAAPGRETLLPLVPEFVHDVDLENRIIRLAIPAGLLDD